MSDLHTLDVTASRLSMEPPTEQDGRTRCIAVAAQGQKEHRVIL